MILVDTSVWSLALRCRARTLSVGESSLIKRWAELAAGGEAALLGVIRQEILSGIRHREQFDRLRTALDSFVCLRVSLEDHDRAAECFNACRSEGIAPTAVDMLICAVALHYRLPVMTVDADFGRYAACLGVSLYRR